MTATHLSFRLATVSATLALAAVGAAHAQSSVVLYGLVDAGLDYSRAGTSLTRVISGGSVGNRVGFRGSEDLGGGLSAVFRLEQGLNLDDGSLGQGGRAFGREASVGLSGRGWGTVSVGRLPTPYYSVQNGVDAFAWMGSGGMLALTRSGTPTRQILPTAVDARHDNAIGYVSPRWAGIELRALASLDEDSTTVGKGAGVSARYTAGGLDLVAGYTQRKAGSAGTGKVWGGVIGGSYDFKVAKVYAGYTKEENDCTNCAGALARIAGVTGTRAQDFRIANLGVRVPFGAATAIAQVARVQDRSQYTVDPGDRDATWWGIGGEYAFSRRTVAYASLAAIENNNGSEYALGSGTAQMPAGRVAAGNPTSTTFAIGVRHAF